MKIKHLIILATLCAPANAYACGFHAPRLLPYANATWAHKLFWIGTAWSILSMGLMMLASWQVKKREEKKAWKVLLCYGVLTSVASMALGLYGLFSIDTFATAYDVVKISVHY